MSLIVAARFPTFEESAHAVRRLMQAGLPGDAVHTFYVNTSGAQRAVPAGDGRYVEPKARGSGPGAVTGAALLGLVLAVLCGGIAAGFNSPAYIVLLGAGVGGYVGTLLGALWLAGEWRFFAPATNPDRHSRVRHTGVMLAVQVPAGKEDLVSETLRQSGGEDLERAQGKWVDGAWVDFDPLKPPHPVHETGEQDTAGQEIAGQETAEPRAADISGKSSGRHG